jgi:KipI family sensor histidine kinase inhibitor
MQYTPPMRFVDASDSSVLVIFGDTISPELNSEVVALFHALESARRPFIQNLHPAYASLLIDFDPLQVSHADLRSLVLQVEQNSIHRQQESRLIDIPVCYGGELGPDLADLARHCGMTEEGVILAHAGASYTVFFLGFAPGFAYLGGLPSEIAAPRLDTPRKLVPAGSVGIAGDQTGIYPNDSPGGWRLIGRTPMKMFDAGAATPALLQPGDEVRFVAIDRAAYDGMVGR